MSVPLLQHFLRILRRILPVHHLLRVPRRCLWYIWCLLTRRNNRKNVRRVEESNKEGGIEGDERWCGSGGPSVGFGKQHELFSHEPCFLPPGNAIKRAAELNKESSIEVEGSWEPKLSGVGTGQNFFRSEPYLVPPSDAVVVCASEVPSSLHPYSFNNPKATISSQELRKTNLQEDFSTKNLSYPRIAHPATSGQPQGTVTKLTASPAPSISRLSINGPHGETASRVTVSPTGSHVSINVQKPDEVTPSPSRLEHVIHVPQLDLNPDRMPGMTRTPELTAEPASMEDGEEGAAQGYNIGSIATSPVEEPEHATLEDIVDTLHKVYDDFYPMAPEIYFRYFKEDNIEPLLTKYELAPMTTKFWTCHLPYGWKEFLHPEVQRIYTDADIYNPSVLKHATRLIKEFDDYTRERHITLTMNMNVVFDMFYDPAEETCLCRYYIVDHDTRSVMWLDRFDTEQLDVWGSVKGVTELTHIGHAIESQYWYHCELFPDSFHMREAEVDELKDIITYWICDVLTSQASTIPYAIDELQPMLSLTNNLRTNIHSKRGVSTYARLMHIFARQRFLDFHGHPAVRLDRSKSVHRPTDVQPHSWLLGCLSPLMLSAPNTHCREISKIWVDQRIHKAAWNKFINNMNTEWQELSLFGTVLLNANVAFLAIQSVDEATAVLGRSPAQILSFLSVVSSIGSVIVGLTLARKNRIEHKETEAEIFLNSFEAEHMGLETLAMLYSLPYALLMWGVILFLAAFSYYCLAGSALYVRLIVAGAWIIVSFLALWCIFTLASWGHRFDAQMTAWGKVIMAIKHAFNKTVEATKRKLMVLRQRRPGPELPGPPVLGSVVDIAGGRQWRLTNSV
ncbi:hypothetical protein L218DRAFT_1005630 [Marasmius fiardii PR-910]|nr:hypothetical protein L218DRAFT_1005630 [Marasmius fiardii PR-910]